jgi:hypothetical protein
MVLTLGGVRLRIEDATRRVVWSSRWDLMDELVSAEYLTCKHFGVGSFGHVDYYMVEVSR